MFCCKHKGSSTNKVNYKDSIHNVNIINEKVLVTPQELKEKLPLPAELHRQIERSRKKLQILFIRKINGCWWLLDLVQFMILLLR